MIPIPLLGGESPGRFALTLFAALVPALLAWWNDGQLLRQRDDPALPESPRSRTRRVSCTAL